MKAFNPFLLSIILVIGMFASCQNSRKELVVQKLEINPNETAQIQLSQLYSEVEIINLNESNEVFARPNKLIAKNNCLYLLSGPAIWVYDFDRKLKLNLIRRGNGAGEYLGIADFQIEDNGDILINDLDGRKMIRYNAKGEHLNTINHGLLSYNFIKIDDVVYLNSGVLLNNKSSYRVNCWDEKTASLTHGYIKQDKNLSYLSVIEDKNFSGFNDTILYCQSFSNTIFRLTNEEAIPYLKIDFEACSMPESFPKEYSQLRPFMEDIRLSGYASRIDGYYENAQYRFFMYSYKDLRPFVWHSKQTDQIFHFSLFEDDLLFPGIVQETGYNSKPVFMDGNYVYVSMEAYLFKELYEKHSAQSLQATVQITASEKLQKSPYQQTLNEIYNTLDINSNTLIIRYKIKS